MARKKSTSAKKAPAIAKGAAAPTEAKATEAAPSKAADASAAKPAETPANTDSAGSVGEAPKNYSRGEGQKPVTQAYKDNWNAIFGKKKKR
jgi:hypothetical protein